MRHLVRVRLREGRATCGACDIITARGISHQPVEATHEAQHIRHEDVGDGESLGQPLALRLGVSSLITALRR
jgi:hypothetical protein